METVFITIHDLSLDARIRYVSDSVEDILGYLPHEVRGKSCWEYFHPDQIPFAREIHGRGIQLDKAAVLNYCQIRHKDGSWIGCECVFTLVYDVLVATTSIYRRGPRSRQRALKAPGIRRIFSSSPKDPRYHMLSYISNKFYTEPRAQLHEPRAALFLNRFTRTSTVMFATDSVSSILGISAQQLTGKSFYYCIAENCLKDAVQCLESAKANDSIAYLRFWYRDPMQDAHRARDTSMPDISSDEEDNDEGGVRIRSLSPEDQSQRRIGSLEARINSQEAILASQPREEVEKSRSSSGNSADLDNNEDDVFDPPAQRSSSSDMTPVDDGPLEVEAVISCTSDGLVVILRRARPFMPTTLGAEAPHFANGLFASPWATDPVMPAGAGDISPLNYGSPPSTEPEPADFLSAIRDVAVFAWSLTGINGDIAQYGRGTPMGEALPPGGLPVYDPASSDPDGEKYNGFMSGSHRPVDPDAIEKLFDADRKDEETTSSEDEVIYKRVPQIPAFRRPKRRAHQDAFGSDTEGTDLDKRPSKRNTKSEGVRLTPGSLSPMKMNNAGNDSV